MMRRMLQWWFLLALGGVPLLALGQPEAQAPRPTAEPPLSAAEPLLDQKLNLNTSSGDQFLTVPGVGQRMVREFMEYRPYRSIQEFRREIGKYVSSEQVAEYEKYVFVPITINQADAATLQQIPGISADLAGRLIAARPYASQEAFMTVLAGAIGDAGADEARYLIVE